MYLNAKLAFLLSTCHKFSDAFMAAMTRQFEKSKTVATRHYFTFYINLYEPQEPKYNEKFAVRDTYFEFAGSDDIILAEALQLHNNSMLSWEMKVIYNNLLRQNIKLEVPEIIGVYTIASLIKYYRGTGFKYIFIPVIIDYGRGGNIVHQTGLIIDFSGQFLFYEPYGKYMKYGKSYSEAVCAFFRIFDGCRLFGGQDVRASTYHDFLGLNGDAGGIQHIILKRNNARADVFNAEYKKLVDEIKKEYPDNVIAPYNKNSLGNEGHDKDGNDDYTANIVTLLNNLDSSFLDSSSDKNKKETYLRLLNKALEYYCCYNSKTCVTITLVEMYEFFKASELNNNITEKIGALYDEFKVDKPNSVLMLKLNKLLDIFKNSADIREIINNETNIGRACYKLFIRI
jgi:hypothetical protein